MSRRTPTTFALFGNCSRRNRRSRSIRAYLCTSGIFTWSCYLQLTGDLAEIPDAGLPSDPLRGTHRAFGKSPARKRFMLQLDQLIVGTSLEDMNSGNIALA